MDKKNSVSYYAPLQIYFKKNMMSIKKFADIEAVLYLMLTLTQNADSEKSYLIFSLYNIIGMKKGTSTDRNLQLACNSLSSYRSKKCWQDDLKEYQSELYNGFRAFTFKYVNNKTVLMINKEKTPLSYEERIKEWKKNWISKNVVKEEYPTAGEGEYYYFAEKENSEKSEKIKVSFSKNILISNKPKEKLTPKKVTSITISISELLECAKEMKNINPNDYCYEILKDNTIKSVENNKVVLCDNLNISQIVNIVGMVGSGKSTLIKVLAFWANKNDKKIVIVLDTVMEVFNLWQYLNDLSVNCSPLVGKSERLKYINQIFEPDKICLSSSVSQYLTNACFVEGMNDTDKECITYGKEPCYSLKQSDKNKSFLCPYFGGLFGY